MRVEGELAAVSVVSRESRMESSRVANCDAIRELVGPVHVLNGGIKLFDARTSKAISQSSPLDESIIYFVADSQTADERVLVVTWDVDGIICIIMADSGELAGQWKGFSNDANDVAMYIETGMGMGAYDSGL
jgi:predicted RNA-binding protein with PIN domain